MSDLKEFETPSLILGEGDVLWDDADIPQSEAQNPVNEELESADEDAAEPMILNIEKKSAMPSESTLYIPARSVTLPIIEEGDAKSCDDAPHLTYEQMVISEYESELEKKHGKVGIDYLALCGSAEYVSSSEVALDVTPYTFDYMAKDTVRRIGKIDKEITKLDGAGARASGLVGGAQVFSKIAFMKEEIDLLCPALCCAVRFRHRGWISKFKKLLTLRISGYNSLLREVEIHTGADLPLLSATIPQDIINGGMYQKTREIALNEIPGGADFYLERHAASERTRLERAGVLYTKKLKKEERELEKILRKRVYKNSAPTSDELRSLKEALSSLGDERIEDEDMIGARFKFLIIRASADMYEGKYFFLTRRMKEMDGRYITARNYKRLKRVRARALKAESRDNLRYYEAVLTDVDRADFKRADADRIVLEELKGELEILLKKRAFINRRLANLYIGQEKEGLFGNFEEKCRKARERGIKKAFYGLRKIYRQMERNKVPLDVKEEMCLLMNEKITKCGLINELSVRIKKAEPRYKKDLKKERKKAISSVKRINESITRFKEKRVDASIEKHKTHLSQLLWILCVALVAGGAFVAYKFYMPEITEFFKNLIFGGN